MDIKNVGFKPLYIQNQEINRIQSNMEDSINQVNDNFSVTRNGLFKIGDLKTSVLTEIQFKTLHGNEWALCDGRSIANTALSRLIRVTVLPDFRGNYVRGTASGEAPGTLEAGTGGAAGPDATIRLNFFVKVN